MRVDSTTEAADARAQELCGMFSHELRTPLTSVKGYLALLLKHGEPELDETDQRFLNAALRGANRLEELVEDMLFMTNNGASIVERTSSLSVLVDQEIDRLLPLADAKEIEVVARLDRNVTVQCDPVRIARAIGNLLSNAIKFTLNGGRVDVEVTNEDGLAVLTVLDSGIGIPSEELGFVLNRFYRGSAAADNAIDGIGLGLTISKAIIEAHGGEIEVESEEGNGTLVRMKLPVGG
jgi:signal transduction histidine kinase